jgi:hypothetical protein
VQRFQVRSMFLLSSISTALKQGADRRRFSQLTLRQPTELPPEQRQAHWDVLNRDLAELITEDYAARLIARTVALIPVIRSSITVFSGVCSRHFESQAMGDQYGTLLAGAWALQSSRVPTTADAHALIAGVDWMVGDGLKVSGEAQYVKNLAYDQSDLCRYAPFGLPVNNLTPSAAGNVNPCAATAPDTKARLDTGDTGWMVRGAFGHGDPRQRGQWNVAAGYRYLETDAVLDAYTDNEFHLGGTNAQGYFLSGSYALYDNTLVSLRWLSANEVSGPPLQIDVTQFDILIGF